VLRLATLLLLLLAAAVMAAVGVSRLLEARQQQTGKSLQGPRGNGHLSTRKEGCTGMEVRAAAAAAAVGNGTAKGEGWQRSAVQTFFSWPQPTQPCLEEDVTTVMVVVEWG
jgi:hypothetical protein